MKKLYKKFIFTFYFGYYNLKWRRLIRTILFFVFLIFFINLLSYTEREFYVMIDETRGIKMSSNYPYRFVFLNLSISIVLHFIVFGLISWVVKPFVVTKKADEDF